MPQEGLSPRSRAAQPACHLTFSLARLRHLLPSQPCLAATSFGMLRRRSRPQHRCSTRSPRHERLILCGPRASAVLSSLIVHALSLTVSYTSSVARAGPGWFAAAQRIGMGHRTGGQVLSCGPYRAQSSPAFALLLSPQLPCLWTERGVLVLPFMSSPSALNGPASMTRSLAQEASQARDAAEARSRDKRCRRTR